MPFFSNLADKIAGYTLKLTIIRDGDKLTVMVYPEVSDKEEIQKEIVPLTITGTPTELDQGFFASLGAELDKTKEFASQIKMFDKGLEKAAAKASGKKTTGKSTAKPADSPSKDKQPEMKFEKDVSEDKKTDPDVEKADKETGEIPKVTAAEPITAAAAPEPEPEPENTPDNGVTNESAQDPAVEETDPDEEW